MEALLRGPGDNTSSLSPGSRLSSLSWLGQPIRGQPWPAATDGTRRRGCPRAAGAVPRALTSTSPTPGTAPAVAGTAPLQRRSDSVPRMREIRRGNRVVRLSSEDRVLFPTGETKGDLWDYYAAVAPAIVPHLKDRPFTMKRWREGVAGGSFFQKQAPKGIPDWLPTRQFRTAPREGGTRLVDFPLVNDELALLWMVQFHCIDMNAWYSRIDKPERPDFVVFDLDPPEEEGGFRAAAKVAVLVRDAVKEVGLEGWPKTSGAGGMHVLVPIERRATFPQAHEFAERITRLLAARHPGVVTAEWLKAQAARRLHRLPPERPRQDDRLGLLRAAARRRAGLDAAALGRGDAEARRPRVQHGRRPEAGRARRRPLRAGARGRPAARARARRGPAADDRRRAAEAPPPTAPRTAPVPLASSRASTASSTWLLSTRIPPGRSRRAEHTTRASGAQRAVSRVALAWIPPRSAPSGWSCSPSRPR